MNAQQLQLRTADGLPLFVRRWFPLSECRQLVCLVHGLGEHSGRYADVAETLCRHGIAVQAHDHRGHGRSAGLRGHARGLSWLLDDLQQVCQAARDWRPGLPVYYYGHSMGGGLVLRLALEQRAPVSGLIISSPLLRAASPPPSWKLRVGCWAYRCWPWFRLRSGLHGSDLSHDPQIVQAFRTDPLATRVVSARLGLDILLGGLWALGHAGQLRVPTLLMHGTGDRVTSWTASREFARRAGPICQLRLWSGLYHELHHEVDRQAVLESMVEWMQRGH